MHRQQRTKTKIIHQIKEYDNFFISLVDNNDKLQSLVKKYYINEEIKIFIEINLMMNLILYIYISDVL